LSLADWRNIPPPQVTLLFTAHSIPSRAAKDEPYVRQISESAAKIMEHFTGYNFQLAYQSAPFGFGWLGPDVKSAIRQIGLSSPRKRGPRVDTRDPRVREDDKHYLLIVPLGFACENLETLYELDQIYVPYAQRLGLNVKRAPAPNVHPIFIDLLAKMVLSKVNLQGLSFPR
jgi:ferrochelatase